VSDAVASIQQCVAECAGHIDRLVAPPERAAWRIYAAERIQDAVKEARWNREFLRDLKRALKAKYGR